MKCFNLIINTIMAGIKGGTSMKFIKGGVETIGWKNGVKQWGAVNADGTAAYNAGSTQTSGGNATSTSEYSVSSYSPSTGNYSNGTAFTQTQSYYIQTNYSNYIYTTTRTCQQVTAPTGNGVAGTCVNPNNAIGGTDITTTTAAKSSTGAGPYYRTRTATGTGGAIFYSGNATFSGSVSSVGTASVTASGAAIQALSISPSSFALQSNARTETITFTYRPANSYFNSGTTFSGSVSVTVPAQMPSFGNSNWTGVVAVSASGNPTATAGNGSPVTMLTSGFGTVTSNTNRNVTTRVTIPNGYLNFGNTVDITRTVVQPATVVTSTVTFNIVDSISGATVSSVSSKTGTVGDAFSFYASANASTGHTFASLNNASTSISPSGLGAGTPSINTTFDTWSRLITGSYPSVNTTYTVTISGSCPADVSASISAAVAGIFPTALGGTTAVTVTTLPTAGTFTVTDNRSWITATKSGNNVNISVTSNIGSLSAPRIGTVTVTHSNGSPSDTIVVDQLSSGGAV